MNRKRMIEDKRGQMSIDFLVGISIFIMALSFVAVSVSGMFLPFQTETIDLNSVSYRTSVILVEDAGYWNDGANDGGDWENHINNVSRIGLAIDKMHPNELELNKLAIFKDDTQIDDKELRDKLGLYRIIGGSKVYYGYNIALTSLSGEVLMSRGDEIPNYGDVSSMKRIVNAQTDSIYDFGWCDLRSNHPEKNDKADFIISKQEKDFTVIINGVIIQEPSDLPKLNYIKINEYNKSLGSDYWIWLDSGTGNFIEQTTLPINLPSTPYNDVSRLKITFNKEVFDMEINSIEIKFTQVLIQLGDPVNLDDIEETIISESAILKVNIWK